MEEGTHFREETAEADIAIWKEALFGADILLLHASPVFYGLGVPHGDGAAVIVIPGSGYPRRRSLHVSTNAQQYWIIRFRG